MLDFGTGLGLIGVDDSKFKNSKSISLSGEVFFLGGSPTGIAARESKKSSADFGEVVTFGEFDDGDDDGESHAAKKVSGAGDNDGDPLPAATSVGESTVGESPPVESVREGPDEKTGVLLDCFIFGDRSRFSFLLGTESFSEDPALCVGEPFVVVGVPGFSGARTGPPF